jgi:hypothetical protein
MIGINIYHPQALSPVGVPAALQKRLAWIKIAVAKSTMCINRYPRLVKNIRSPFLVFGCRFIRILIRENEMMWAIIKVATAITIGRTKYRRPWIVRIIVRMIFL